MFISIVIMILCVTHSSDFYTIDIVQQYLQKKGYASFRFNTDEFGMQYRFGYTLQEYELVAGGQSIRVSQIQAVWHRKLWEMKVPEALDPAYRDIFTREYQTGRDVFFHALQHLPWMNALPAAHATGNDKLRQLSAARAAGLAVPQTIFTNDAKAALGFFNHCNADIVVKLHNALSNSMQGNAPFFPTTKLTAGDERHFDQLAYCPMILQEYIHKQYELRTIYVDGAFFTGKIAFTGAEPADWRTLKTGSAHWQRYELPLPVQQKIDMLMRSLQLTFGAIDIIRRRPGGEYVFLEVNPQGEWGMLQKELGYPIGETIAEKLISRIKNGQ